MSKPAENTAIVIGAVVTGVNFVSKTYFHTSLSSDTLASLPLVIGAVPHFVTAGVDYVRSLRDRSAAAKVADAAKAKAEFSAAVDGAVEAKVAEIIAAKVGPVVAGEIGIPPHTP